MRPTNYLLIWVYYRIIMEWLWKAQIDVVVSNNYIKLVKVSVIDTKGRFNTKLVKVSIIDTKGRFKRENEMIQLQKLSDD